MEKKSGDDQEVREVEDSKRREAESESLEGGKKKRRKRDGTGDKENVEGTAEADVKCERKRRREDQRNGESPAENGGKKKKRRLGSETAVDDPEQDGEGTEEADGSGSQNKNEEVKRKKKKKALSSEQDGNEKKRSRSSDVSEEVVDREKDLKKHKGVGNDKLPAVSVDDVPRRVNKKATSKMNKAAKDHNNESRVETGGDKKAKCTTGTGKENSHSEPGSKASIKKADSAEENEARRKKKKKASGDQASEQDGNDTTKSPSADVSEQVTEIKKKRKKQTIVGEKQLPAESVEEGSGSKKNEKTGSLIASETVNEATAGKRKRARSTELDDDAAHQRKKQKQKDCERPAETTGVHDAGSAALEQDKKARIENGREESAADGSKKKKEKEKKLFTVEAEAQDSRADSPKEADKLVKKTKKQSPVVESQGDSQKTKQNTVTCTGDSGISGGEKETEPLASVPQKKKKKVTFAMDLVTDTKAGDVQKFPEGEPKPKRKVTFGEAVVMSTSPQLERPLYHKKQTDPLFLKKFTAEEISLIKQKIDWLVEEKGLGWSQEEMYEFLLKGWTTDKALYKDLWSHIRTCVPGRSKTATTNRAKNFLMSETCPNKGKWSQEEVDQLMLLVEKHGKKWRIISETLGRTRTDAYHKYHYLTAHKIKGHYSDDDITRVTEAVHKMLAENVKHARPVMRRDDICWRSVEKMVGRPNSHCRVLWYRDLCSHMITKGDWQTRDDHIMLLRLLESGATEESEVDWDNLLSHRSGEFCRNRWQEMRAHLGHRWSWPLDKKLEILVKRFAPCFLENKEGPCPVQEAVDPVPCDHDHHDEAEEHER